MITKPTPKEVGARLEVLPERLSAAAFSMKTTDLIIDIAAKNKLDQRTTSLLSEVVAWVLMGFVHSSGVHEAIQEYAGVAPEIARGIAGELNEKLFRAYNADLDKVYTPMGLPPIKTMDSAAPMPLKISSIAPAPMPISSIPVPGPTPSPVSKSPAPAQLPATQPTTAATPGAAPKPWQPTKLSVPGATPVPTPAPAPFMIHEESSAAPLVSGAGFKLNMPTSMFKSPQVAKVDIPRPPAKAANLEIGKAPLPPKAPASASFQTVPAMQSRVIHYTDLRSSLSPGPGTVPPPAVPMPAVPPAPATKPIFPSFPTGSIPPKAPAALPPLEANTVAPMAPLPPTRAPFRPMTTPVAVPAPIMPKAPPPPIAKPVIPATPVQSASPKPPGAQPPAPPLPPKPPKVVNFGPEEVK